MFRRRSALSSRPFGVGGPARTAPTMCSVCSQPELVAARTPALRTASSSSALGRTPRLDPGARCARSTHARRSRPAHRWGRRRPSLHAPDRRVDAEAVTRDGVAFGTAYRPNRERCRGESGSAEHGFTAGRPDPSTGGSSSLPRLFPPSIPAGPTRSRAQVSRARHDDEVHRAPSKRLTRCCHSTPYRTSTGGKPR